MSRSAIVALVVGLLMLGALAIVESHFWPGFSTRSHLAIGLVLTLAIYGALLTAVCFRRIIDPWLPTPILAWILMWIWWVFDFITDLMRPADVIIVEEVIVYDDDGVAHDDGMGYGWAIFMTLIGIGMFATGIALTHYLAKHRMHHFAPTTKVVKHREPEPPRPEPPQPTTPAPSKPSPSKPSPRSEHAKASKDAKDAKDLAAAIAIALPSMTDDNRDSPSPGTIQLARYAAAKLRWNEVAVAHDETSLALAEKDPPKAFGKRLCESGTLERIAKQHLWGVELHAARMVTKSGDALEMLVAGNTGTLVKRNQTRFCGVVTGRLDARGKPATLAVGMFETAK